MKHLDHIEHDAVSFEDLFAPSIDSLQQFWGDEWTLLVSTRLGQRILVNKPLMTYALALELAVTQTAAHLLRRKMQALGGLCDAYVATCVDHVFSIPARVYSVTA
jgi:hypothetical protein